MPSAIRFAPDILRRLGEELVPNPDQGILELVKNAYDADAETCTVSLAAADAVGGTITITDDGDGMTRTDIVGNWLVLGRSAKVSKAATKKGRVPVGDKGLGRLAAMRLGSKVTLKTRHRADPSLQLTATIDWTKYLKAKTVESVPVSISKKRSPGKPGTTIEVRNLTSALGRQEVQRLARSLLLLADPFDNQLGFKPSLESPQFVDLEEMVKTAYFSEAEVHLVAELDGKGKPSAKVVDWAGKTLWEAGPGEPAERSYAAPACKFDLWTFSLTSRDFNTKAASLSEVRKWLEVVGGVHLYHGGLRVHPYGDPGHDWLDMNLARAKSPEFRPSTNNSVGKVEVADIDNILRQKTDRSGFVETDSFRELREFLTDSLNWMAKKRLAAGEKRRTLKRTGPRKQARVAQVALKKVLKAAPETLKVDIEKLVQDLEDARTKEADALREDLELYRTLSTVGTTISVFAHESAKPVTQIEKMSQELERRLVQEFPKQTPVYAKPLELIARSAKALRSFAKLPIDLLKREKRRTGLVDLDATIGGIVTLFDPFLADAKITLTQTLASGSPKLQGSIASLEAVLANLITNSINAFKSAESRVSKRIIELETTLVDDHVILAIRDNGPGIKGITLDDIWLPGQSTTEGGTGLGLTIVRDSVADLGGEVSAVAHGHLGGAEVTVTLPLLK